MNESPQRSNVCRADDRKKTMRGLTEKHWLDVRTRWERRCRFDAIIRPESPRAERPRGLNGGQRD